MEQTLTQLISSFNQDTLIRFFRESISSFRSEEEDLTHVLTDILSESFVTVTKLGEASYDSGDELMVFTCQVKDTLSTRSAKKRQYDLAKRILKDDFKDGAIFVFYDDEGRFRFSFIRRNYGAATAQDRYTPWKRYTYFVDPAKNNKTFRRRIGVCTFSSLDEIQEAFAVEPLSKQFYKELSHWYFGALQNVTFPNDRDKHEYTVHANALIRLITRLIFVWFMKQKGLVPNEFFDKEYLDRLLDYKDKTGSTYYKAILQNLFFATLNTPREKGRIFVNRQYGIPNFFRYRRFIKDEQTFLNLMDQVPFLNGGLFENLDIINPDEGIEIRIDCFSDSTRNEERLSVPDHLFFGGFEADISSYMEGNSPAHIPIKGIIDILEQYDFTIDENTASDQEVALDPELLGLVFENLLASYNPETSSTARKESGSFYTPRPIVDYMVVESLSHYLHSSTALTVDDLRTVFNDDEVSTIQEIEDKVSVIDAMSELKIIDPACGSGAFPMGTLQKMVHGLTKLDPDNALWRQSQERRIKKHIADKLDDMSLEDIRKELDRNFDHDTNDPDYARKLYLIENCLYGVDIQPIAMQISKLRFFISLLVEQKIEREADNFGILALPNLETKFVAANTLIKLKSSANTGLLKNLKLEKLEQELDDLRHRYFTARTPKTKKKRRDEIKAIRSEMAEILKTDGWDNAEAQKIAKWNPFDTNSKSKWFDTKWMFGVDYFDIVIGNPPYIQLQKALPGSDNDKYADVYKDQGYQTFERTGDIYALFYERGLDILHPKGVLCYITSNKWMRARYGASLRKLCSQRHPLLLIDLGPGVFDSATVDVNILLMQNHKVKQHDLQSMTLRDKDVINHLDASHFTLMDELGEDSWIILSPEEMAIKKKIERIGKPLKEWDVSINRGVLTGYNDAFIIDGALKDKLIAEDPKSADIIKPLLRGRDIKRYRAEFGDQWLIATHNGYTNSDGVRAPPVNVDEYPAIKRWLDTNWDSLVNRADQGVTPYNLRNCAYWEDFEKKKVMYQEMVQESNFLLDENSGYYCNDTGRIISGNKIHYLLSILNSKAFFFFIKRFYGGGGLGESGVRMKHTFFEKCPIPQTNTKVEEELTKLVDQVHTLKHKDQSSEIIELQIDLMVYKLYELTYDEVLVVDAGTDIGREEYENFEL